MGRFRNANFVDHNTNIVLLHVLDRTYQGQGFSYGSRLLLLRNRKLWDDLVRSQQNATTLGGDDGTLKTDGC